MSKVDSQIGWPSMDDGADSGNQADTESSGPDTPLVHPKDIDKSTSPSIQLAVPNFKENVKAMQDSDS